MTRRLSPFPSRRRASARPRQRGVALLVAMLLLALMMVVGSSSLESAIVEYKVTGNMRDRSASFEGAEAATLQSFARLRQLVATGNSEPIESGGLYYGGRLPAVGGGSVTEIDSGSLKFWRTWGMPDDDTTMQTLLPQTIAHVDKSRYVIERLAIDDEGEPSGPTTYPLNYSRLTVFGKGEAAAEVLLQATLVTLPK
jgi:type IV pilus assembly protein PilX